MTENKIPEMNPYITKKKKKKWDITDIKKYFRDMKLKPRIMWSNYFSNNLLDALNV